MILKLAVQECTIVSYVYCLVTYINITCDRFYYQNVVHLRLVIL